MDAATATRSFILQAPPGELNDCIADCRGLFGDEVVDPGLASAVEGYQLDQLAVVDVPGHQHQLILCRPAQLPGELDRYWDPRSMQSVSYSYLESSATDPRPVTVDQTLEPLRKALEAAALVYVQEHLSQGVGAVFAPLPKQTSPSPAAPEQVPESLEATVDETIAEDHTPATGEPDASAEEAQPTEQPSEAAEPEPSSAEAVEESQEAPMEEADLAEGTDDVPPAGDSTDPPTVEAAPEEEPEPLPKLFQIAMVGNKYNPSNFWTGRWRSLFTVDLEKGLLSGQVQIAVHYYEQGNVQLSVAKRIEQDFAHPSEDPALIAKEVFKRVGSAEKELQLAINEAHVEMNDRTLRDLRRTLPLTKSKLDWNRIALFRTAKELKRVDP